MLIRNVEIDGSRVDVRIQISVIQAISGQLQPMKNEPVCDGQGGALLPGLHDHHIHLNATAAALNSVRCGPPDVQNAQELAAALNSKRSADWLRGIGYHPTVAGEIDRDWLDRNGPNKPIRIQHRSGRLWIFNSRAMDLLEADIPENGRLLDGDTVVRKALGSQRPDLRPLIQKLHSYGITGVTEVTPGNDWVDFEHYRDTAQPLNLCIMGGADLNEVTGSNADIIGPLKIHNHDHDLPSLAALTRQIDKSHGHNRAVAIHCVTRAELMLSLAAIEDAGPHRGDRIEHAAIADKASIEWMARLGVTVVTQPHFVAERGAAYLSEVEPDDIANLWRLKSLADAGIKLAAGSDAPFGDFDPWTGMASAVNRPAGLAELEAISPEEAVALYTKPAADAGGTPRKITVGKRADLCLLDRSWSVARNRLSDVTVQATWIGGALVYDTISSTNPQSSAV